MTKDEIERAYIVVMDSGERFEVYPGEGADDESFAGEMLDPPERMARLGVHVSCMWDCSKVASVATPTSETDQLGGVGV